jgi:hypothetical protein
VPLNLVVAVVPGQPDCLGQGLLGRCVAAELPVYVAKVEEHFRQQGRTLGRPGGRQRLGEQGAGAAVAMMVPKTWREPGSETLSTFTWASVGGALSAAAECRLEFSLLLYPTYYCLVNGGLALLIAVRRTTRHVGGAGTPRSCRK